MCKKSLLIALLLALFMPWAAQAQETVTIGDGTSTSRNVPIGTYYNYSITEQLYTADEIGTAGTISSISFNYAVSTAKDFPIAVYMMNTDAADLSTGISLADAELVFDGTLSVTGPGWATITLDTPFAYDGTSNLLIGINKGYVKYYNDYTWYCTGGSNVMTRYSQNDSNAYNAATASFSNSSYDRPNIQIEITPAGGATCAKPDNLIAYNEPTATSFYFSIDGGSGVYNIELKEGSGDWEPSISHYTDTVYGWNDLESNTAYQVRVQSVCTDMTNPETGDPATSGWKTLNFTTANPCAAPTNLQVSDITTESATLTWTAGYQETTWTVKYKKSTDSEYTTETVSGTPTLTLSSLASNTTYNVQVYNCENYVSANFTTQVGIPLTEAFATTSAPAGWTRYSALLSTVMDGGSLGNAVTSGWSFGTTNGVFDSHTRVNLYGTSCKYWLVTPTLLMEDNVQLTFDLALTAYSGTLTAPATTGTDDKFVVLISTDNMATWTILRQWDNAGSEYVLNNIACSAIGETVAIDLSSYAGQSIAIAFYGESTVSNADNNLHIDNVSIDYIPACAKPTGLAASDVTAHEATITWTSAANDWQICVNDDEENLIDVSDTTYTLTGLAPETAYTVKVRTNCGDEGYSDWTGNVSFTTLEACPAPTGFAVAENGLTGHTATLNWQGTSNEYQVRYRTAAYMDGIEEGFNSNPAGWSFKQGALNADGTATLSGNTSWSRATGNGVFDTHIYMNMYGTKNYWLITPSMEIQNGYALSFDMAYTAYSGTQATPALNCTTHRFAVLISTDDMQHWIILREWNNSGSEYVLDQVSTSGENSGNIDLSAYAGQTAYIAFFGHAEVTSYDNNFHFDNVAIGIPVPAGEMQYATNITEQTVTLQGLLAETEYEAWLQGDCGSEGPSTEVGPISFTTLDVIIWNNPEDWTVPEDHADVTIPANTQVIIPSGCTAYADTITFGEGASILIENGGQLYHSNEVPVTMQLAYDPNYTSSKDGETEYGEYRLIAAPVNPGVPVSSTGLVPESTDPNYDYVDLYYFDQNVGELVWINYKYEANHFDSLFIKKGYLYSNAQNVLGIFGGNTLPTNVDVKEPLEYNPDVLWAGWNLVGNPFTCMAFVDRPYYKINGDGNAIAQAEGNSLEVFEGVFVYTEQADDTVTFFTSGATGSNPGPDEWDKMLTLNLNDGRSLIDRAIVRFDEGRQLLKLQMGSSTKVYIPKDGSDYAIVSSDDAGEMPVSFKAENDGTYTMNFSSENINFSYLHLIDNKTGDDIDLLETPSYTFTARTNDYTNRFKLVFALGTTGIEESFAFFNNGNLVISNEGNATLQVVDVMGRILKSENINGSASVKVDAAPGVYMIRLTNGSNVKVQKVVVE